MFNTLMSLVPVDVLLKVYLKVPLPFLLYINNLGSSLNDHAVITFFADDFSIFTTSCKKEVDEAAAQPVVNSVLIWSQE